MPPRKKAVRRKKAAPASVGLTTSETRAVDDAAVDELSSRVEADGGAVLGKYNDPFGGKPLLVVALLVPDAAVAFKILALNTEKAHNLREKSLETIRMARALAREGSRPETEYAFEFEQPAYLTLGVCYEERPRISGGAYQSILRRVDEFLDRPIGQALKERERRGKKILKLDDAVSAAVEKLKARGLTSPYLKPFVVSRVNFTRFSKATSFDFDETLDKIIASAARFNVDRVKQEDVAKAGGGPPEDGG